MLDYYSTSSISQQAAQDSCSKACLKHAQLAAQSSLNSSAELSMSSSLALPLNSSLKQVFGDWLSTLANWEWFATFTFRDPQDSRFPGWTMVGWKAAHNALKKWGSQMISACLGDLQPRWVGVMEYQKMRGVPHWHLLVANVPEGIRRMSWVDWWFEHYGIARILPYDKQLGARYYLGRYLTKEVADIQFSQGLSLDKNHI